MLKIAFIQILNLNKIDAKRFRRAAESWRIEVRPRPLAPHDASAPHPPSPTKRLLEGRGAVGGVLKDAPTERVSAPSEGADATYNQVMGGYGWGACLLRFRIFLSLPLSFKPSRLAGAISADVRSAERACRSELIMRERRLRSE